MAIAWMQEFKIDGDDRSTTNYDGVTAQLNLDANPPEGLIVHTAGWDEDDGVFRIFDVWESAAHAESFVRERLQPLLDQMTANTDNAAGPDREGTYELHGVVRG